MQQQQRGSSENGGEEAGVLRRGSGKSVGDAAGVVGMQYCSSGESGRNAAVGTLHEWRESRSGNVAVVE